MNFHIHPSRSELASAAARWCVSELRRVLQTRAEAVFCPSVDDVSKAVFARIRDGHASALDWSRVRVVQMAEFADPGLAHADRLATDLIDGLIDPLGTRAFLMWQGDVGHEYSVEPRSHARRLPAIDVAMHSLAADGSLGFNRPGRPRRAGQVANVDTGPSVAPSSRAPFRGSLSRGSLSHSGPSRSGLSRKALTLTPAPLRAARRSLVVASGTGRSIALHALMHGAPATLCPVAAIPHSRLSVMADERAAPAFTAPAGPPSIAVPA